MDWSAQQYLKFEDERTRPARDLLDHIPLSTISAGYDLGCGPGNSTQLLTERFGNDVIAGVDSDLDMLDKAKLRLPLIRFEQVDLANWVPDEPADLFYANAVFQWLPQHLDLFTRLMGHLKPGGVLAVQMPDNLDQPSHMMMEETGNNGPWRARFSGQKLRRRPLPETHVYINALQPHAAKVDLWRTTYYHPMDDAQAIVEWVKGTGLRPYLDALDSKDRDAFLADYTARIDKAYQPLANGKRLLAFPRLFMIAVKRD